MTAYTIALTGSIGMGKSTTAAMFAEHGIPIWDADAAVHRLYEPKGAAARALAGIVPDAVTEFGVNRGTLRDAIIADPSLMKQVEAVVHPLVAEDRATFLAQTSSPIVLFDIPLLFETGQSDAYDKVVVVTAPSEVQRQRVMDRPEMTDQAFDAILARQLPDADKRAKADEVIDTGAGLDAARARVAEILADIRDELGAADGNA